MNQFFRVIDSHNPVTHIIEDSLYFALFGGDLSKSAVQTGGQIVIHVNQLSDLIIGVCLHSLGKITA